MCCYPAQSPLHPGRCHCMVWRSSYTYPTLTRALWHLLPGATAQHAYAQLEMILFFPPPCHCFEIQTEDPYGYEERCLQLWFLVPDVLVPGQVTFIHGKSQKKEAQQLDLWLRKSQGLNCSHSDLASFVSGPLLLAHSSFQSCLSSFQERPGGSDQRVLLTLGDMD